MAQKRLGDASYSRTNPSIDSNHRSGEISGENYLELVCENSCSRKTMGVSQAS